MKFDESQMPLHEMPGASEVTNSRGNNITPYQDILNIIVQRVIGASSMLWGDDFGMPEWFTDEERRQDYVERLISDYIQSCEHEILIGNNWNLSTITGLDLFHQLL